LPAPQELLERYRCGGRSRRAERERHRERARKRAPRATEARAQQRRHAGLRDRDGGAREERPKKEPADAGDPAESGARRSERSARRDDALDRDAAYERRGERRKRAEAEHGRRGEQARRGAAQSKVLAHVLEQRRQAREDGAHVGAREHDSGEEEEARTARHGAASSRVARAAPSCMHFGRSRGRTLPRRPQLHAVSSTEPTPAAGPTSCRGGRRR
jgi:hypothetical protein